jgi:predicted metalloprotease with PDZ domain
MRRGVLAFLCAALWFWGSAGPDAIVYTIRFPNPASKSFTVTMTVPAGGRPAVDLMIPVWSPGYYGLETYAQRVSAFHAEADGTALDVTRPAENRWHVPTGGRPSFTATYTVAAPRGSNLSNGVTETSAVIVGPATFITLVEPSGTRRPADVTLELPRAWKGAVTPLDAAHDGTPNHYVAPDYDVLVDSPILAGTELTTTDFTVRGIRHHWTCLGHADWIGAKAAALLTPLVEEHVRFWGSVPYSSYTFLNIVNGGDSGVEHLSSVAITTDGKPPETRWARFSEAAFISHEYFHAMNVKRLRPIELGPFDYEHPPRTTGLWVAEGLTSYYGDLLAARAGIGTPNDYLSMESGHISDLQKKQPGRLVLSMEQASAQMADNLPAGKTVDYYVKGPVVGLVLDAHIRHLSNGKRSLDDVMRLEYQRWSGARGYTAEDFVKTASDAAGVNVGPLIHRLVATTEEVDYREMLNWYGLRFTDDKSWTLEVRPHPTKEEQAHFAALMAHSKP